MHTCFWNEPSQVSDRVAFAELEWKYYSFWSIKARERDLKIFLFNYCNDLVLSSVETYFVKVGAYVFLKWATTGDWPPATNFILVLWCRTDICSCKNFVKISLMLDIPFWVPSLCKLSHISICFIRISTKITCKQLITFKESHVFFEVIPSVLGRSINFNITQRFLLRRHVFPDYLSVSYEKC